MTTIATYEDFPLSIPHSTVEAHLRMMMTTSVYEFFPLSIPPRSVEDITKEVTKIIGQIAEIEWKKLNQTGTALVPSVEDLHIFFQSSDQMQGVIMKEVLTILPLWEAEQDITQERLIFRQAIMISYIGIIVSEKFDSKLMSLFWLLMPWQKPVPPVPQEIFETEMRQPATNFSIPAYFSHFFWQVVRDHLTQKYDKEKVDIPPHPLQMAIRTWQQEQTAKPVTAEYDRKRPVGVLKHPTGSIRELAFIESELGILREFATPDSVKQVASEQLPLFDGEKKVSVLPAVMPLEIAHPVGLTLTTKRGAVSHTVRIFFEALMALEPTETQADIMFTLGDLISYLYPDGKFNRTNQLPYIIEALDMLHSGATVPYESGAGKIGDWRPVVVRTRIRKTDGNDARIFLDVKLPPDARQGMAVDKHTLRLLGKTSAPKFNAYLTATWLWDKRGTHNGKIIDPTKPAERRNDEGVIVDPSGRPILTKRGKPLKNIYDKEAVRQLDRVMNPEAVKQYPILSNNDLVASCYPVKKSGNYTRKDLQRARMYWEQLEAAGIVRIERLQSGWRILPSEQHIARYRGLKEAQKRRR